MRRRSISFELFPMTECLNEEEVELSLGLAIGSGGKLRKCSDVVQKNQNDGVLGRPERRKKQEVRRGTVRVDEDVVDARVRKRMKKSEFRLESGVDEGDVSFCSVDGESLSSQQKCSRGTTNNAAAGVKERIACSRGFNSHVDEKVIGPSSVSPPPAVEINLNGQCMSSQALKADKEGAERSVVLPFVPLATMPCVSTTGSGPSGKTVRGFLYRYTKVEVCIVCVCHGFLFSPAKFVEHAGGRNVENPLRHITVSPFPSPGP